MGVGRLGPGTDPPFTFCDWHEPCGNQALKKYLMTAVNKIGTVRLQKHSNILESW